MKISYCRYDLKFKHPFEIAHTKRTHTPVVYLVLEYNSIQGYGEATLPPYLNENQDQVIDFFKVIDFSRATHIKNLDDLTVFLAYVESLDPSKTASRAAIDMALHDYLSKKINISISDLYKINPQNRPPTSYTIGISNSDELEDKIRESNTFSLLKLKLGGINDKETVSEIISLTDKALCVDFNQSLHDKHYALDLAYWLHEKGILFIEQPFDKNNLIDSEWLTHRSPLPVIADEAIQRLSDFDKIKNSFSGINIKLMKCGGINEAYKLLEKARESGLKIMIGCMSESSCGIAAASHLSPLTDWVDLDGAFLIKNDPFKGLELIDGRLITSELIGTGAILASKNHTF